MRQIRVIRIVVASASDVQAERDAIPAVIEYLNKSIAKYRGLWLEVSRWETDAYPTFHPEGPQGAIDEILRIEDCDILIGIFWKRFGTPVKDAQSGTEHEFKVAYDQWKNTGRPQIMFYFNQKPATPKSKSETDQWGQVLEFKQRFPGQGLWWTYKNRAQFEELLRNHLTRFILHQVPLPSQSYSIPPVSLSQESTGKVADHTRSMELSIEMALTQFHELNQKVLRYVIAAFISVSPSEVELVTARESEEGLRVTLNVPAQSAESLLKAYEDENSDLTGFLHAFAAWAAGREHANELNKNEDEEASSGAVSILIVSDEPIISSSLHLLIKSRRGLEVVGVVNNWFEALSMSKDRRPDIIILDHSLIENRTLSFVRKLVKREGGARVLLITDYFTPTICGAAIRLGVSGIITRRNAAEALLKAVEKIRAGETWFDEAATVQRDAGAEESILVENPIQHGLLRGLLSFHPSALSLSFAALLLIVALLIPVWMRSGGMQRSGLTNHLAAVNSSGIESPLTVELEPSQLVRGDYESFSHVRVPASTSHIVFLLHFPQGETHEIYDVSLLNSESRGLFTVSGLKCSEGKKIPVRVVKEFIPSGDYLLTLSHGDEAPIYYMIRVIEGD